MERPCPIRNVDIVGLSADIDAKGVFGQGEKSVTIVLQGWTEFKWRERNFGVVSGG